MKKVQGLFGQPTKVVNIGIEAFYDDSESAEHSGDSDELERSQRGRQT